MPSITHRGLAKKSLRIPASPPDVRRGGPRRLALTYSFGLCPWSGLCPSSLRPQAEPGAQPKLFYLDFRQGRALPHIRRRSRNAEPKRTFVQTHAQVHFDFQLTVLT